MKRHAFRFALPALAILVATILSGCGSGGGGGGVTIRGQVVLNGVGTDQVTMLVSANGILYGGDTITSDGRFSHSDTGLDAEFCVAGTVVTLYFDSTAAGAFDSSAVYHYTVQPGDNNLGQIEIGLKGLTLTNPASGATITSFPTTFEWSAYTRAGIAPSYQLRVIIGFLDYWASAWQAGTSCQVSGTETTPLFGSSLHGPHDWQVVVEYEENGHTMRHHSESRAVTLQPSS